MLVVVYNKSRKKRLKNSKRILSSLLFPIFDRFHIGNIPSRILIDLIRKLKSTSGYGTKIQIFIESKEGFHGVKLITIGSVEEKLRILEYSKSSIDIKLIKEKIINSPNKKQKNKI